MTERELLKKLNSYRNIQADESWKKKGRDILFKQIMNSSSAPETGFSFAKIYNNFKIYSDIFYNGIVKNLGQPIILTSLIVLAVLGGGIMSINASRDTTPGDSLYIAKKISEKTQFAFAFSDKKKAQLNVSFAKNRAKEIAQVMQGEKPEKEKNEIVYKLTGDFKQEIKNVKTRIEKINQKTDTEIPATGDNTDEENVFTANLGKGNEGLSLGKQKEEAPVVPTTKQKQETELTEKKSTTTPETVGIKDGVATTSEEVKKESNNSKDILNEVNDLIENDNFDATLEKLNEASNRFEQEIKNGKVKGIMETNTEETGNASSTEE